MYKPVEHRFENPEREPVPGDECHVVLTCRRLAKDWENFNRSALAFLKLASIRLMLRKLCNPL